MHPGWVTDLDDYWRWLEQVLASSGGYLEDDVLRVEWYPDPEAPSDRPLLLRVPRQRLHFHDGRYLDFHLIVTADLEVVSYGYHLAGHGDALLWRLDKHPDHPGVTETHVHQGDGSVASSPEVDLADVMRRIHLRPSC